MTALGSIAVLTLGAAITTATAAEMTQPAVWSPHALIVDLQNLPKRYSCDDLWYKFRDVLLAIGARPDMKILPYRCDRRSDSLGNSPRVQLEFSIPSLVSGKNARWAEITATPKTVRLEPGSPEHLDESDCALLNQMRQTLLRAIHADVTGFRLACQAPAITRKPPFV